MIEGPVISTSPPAGGTPRRCRVTTRKRQGHLSTGQRSRHRLSKPASGRVPTPRIHVRPAGAHQPGAAIPTSPQQAGQQTGPRRRRYTSAPLVHTSRAAISTSSPAGGTTGRCRVTTRKRRGYLSTRQRSRHRPTRSASAWVLDAEIRGRPRTARFGREGEGRGLTYSRWSYSPSVSSAAALADSAARGGSTARTSGPSRSSSIRSQAGSATSRPIRQPSSVRSLERTG